MQNGERSYAKRRAVSSSGRVIKGVEGRRRPHVIADTHFFD